MSETTPNSKGPAKVQMPPEMLAGLGGTPAPGATASERPGRVPASEVAPEDVGTLTLEYRNGQPVIVVSGGKLIPSALPVVDGSGQMVSAYETVPTSRLKADDLPLLLHPESEGIYVMTYDHFGSGWA
ncbi:hypothetical protein ACFYS8_31880 [Kitasatospora sp. NPDC004615]|uniref:hypothetical protein n=1 Tax=Kitasatospora sp. NPDC004615 TaxID=3364017 RepID=UPI0036BA07AB